MKYENFQILEQKLTQLDQKLKQLEDKIDKQRSWKTSLPRFLPSLLLRFLPPLLIFMLEQYHTFPPTN